MFFAEVYNALKWEEFIFTGTEMCSVYYSSLIKEWETCSSDATSTSYIKQCSGLSTEFFNSSLSGTPSESCSSLHILILSWIYFRSIAWLTALPAPKKLTNILYGSLFALLFENEVVKWRFSFNSCIFVDIISEQNTANAGNINRLCMFVDIGWDVCQVSRIISLRLQEQFCWSGGKSWFLFTEL